MTVALQAADTASYVLQGKTYVFTRVETRGGHRAVALDDPALRALLERIGASVTWQPGEQYILFTTARRKVVSFAVGDTRYDDGPVSQQASIAPFAEDQIPFVPLDEVLRALDIPQRNSVVAASASSVPSPSATSSLAQVGRLDVAPSDRGVTIALTVTGDAVYEWHRLRDNRWYLDIRGARLSDGPKDQAADNPVQSVRVHQLNASTVRIALTLSGENAITVSPNDRGLLVSVATDLAELSAPRAGGGNVGSNAGTVAQSTPVENPAPWKFAAPSSASPDRPPAQSNSHLIVIDPGHGGSDPGSLGNGITEKTVTLDMSKRLRQILVSRGWQVIMTRETDRDVFGPNASGRSELQARIDPAISNGARMFISIHANAFTNSGPHGTTTYYGKAADIPLARAIARRAAESLGTSDNGIVRDANLYLLHHSTVPSVIVETAFLSNPFDAQKLGDPAWRQKVAQAIADAIGDYAGSSRAPSQDSGGQR